jgi:hypothetical protein
MKISSPEIEGGIIKTGTGPQRVEIMNDEICSYASDHLGMKISGYSYKIYSWQEPFLHSVSLYSDSYGFQMTSYNNSRLCFSIEEGDSTVPKFEVDPAVSEIRSNYRHVFKTGLDVAGGIKMYITGVSTDINLARDYNAFYIKEGTTAMFEANYSDNKLYSHYAHIFNSGATVWQDLKLIPHDSGPFAGYTFYAPCCTTPKVKLHYMWVQTSYGTWSTIDYSSIGFTATPYWICNGMDMNNLFAKVNVRNASTTSLEVQTDVLGDGKVNIILIGV